jgi:hypothetical protein
VVEQAFAPDTTITDATEISLADGEGLRRFREFMSA